MLNFETIYSFVIEATTVVCTDVLACHNTKVNTRISILSLYVNTACCFNVGYIIPRCLFIFRRIVLSCAQFCAVTFVLLYIVRS
jgi:hypothetical protein